MKNFLFSLLALSLFGIFNSINAQCSLDQVGTSTVAATSALSDMAVAPDGKTYVLAYNSTTKVIELRVAPTIGSAWNLIGTVPTVTNTTVKPVMEITKAGEIVIFVRDEGNGKIGKVYHSFGGAITQIGPDVSTGPVTDLDIAFSSTNEIFVAFTDVNSSNAVVVRRWNGSVWADVGVGGIASGGAIAHYNSLIIDNTNTPIIAYQDMSAGYKTTIRKYNGSSWVNISTVGSGTTTNSKLRCANNGNYYLGYVEGTNAIVQMYNGSVWAPLGSPVPGILATADLFDMELDPADSPYMIGAESGNSYVVAYKYNGGASWTQVPAGFINAFNSTNTNISFDTKGAPYFAYVDVPTNNTINVKTLSLLSTVTNPTSTLVCNGSSGSMSVAISGTFTPSYQWQVGTSGYFLNAVTPYETAASSSVSFIAVPSMNQDIIRCVVNYGCRNAITNSATLTVSSPTVSLTKTDASCFGICNGSINANTIAGNGPYVYSWTPNVGSGATVTGLCAGNYTATSTDINGCVSSSVINVNSPSGISSSVSGALTICNGATTTLTMNAVGGTPPFTYSWSPGASLSSTNTAVVVASPTTTTIYSATAIDANSCTKTFTVTVTVNPLPALTANNPTICNGGVASLNATGADTYTWNPGNLVGATQNVNPVSNTVYTVSATNTLTGCSNTTTASVTVNNLPVANAGPSATLTCVNTSTTLSGSGGVTYLWTGPGIVSGSTTANPTVNSAGTYSLQVTSAAGCTSTISTVSVSQNTIAPSTSTLAGVLNCTLTSVNASATTTTSPVYYSWTGAGITSAANISTITVNISGTYNYSVTNTSNGCTTVGSVNVTQNSLVPGVSASTTGTVTCTTNTIQLNGTPASGVTYTWSAPGGSSIISGTNTQNAIGSGVGVYTLTVRSLSSGCPNSATVAAIVNTVAPIPTASTSGTLTCSTNSVSLNGGPSTGVTYLWAGSGVSGSSITQNTTANAVGIYSLTVTNSTNGCSATATTAVTQNTTQPLPTATASGSLTCSTTTITLNGGPATGVTYLWTGPGITGSTTSQITTANAPGIYTLTTTNTTNGCTAFITTTVGQDIITPTVTASSSGSITCTTNTVQLNGSNGTGITYLWSGPGFSGGNNTQNVIANNSGTYTLTVQFVSNGCSSTATTTVTQNTTAPIGVNAGSDQTLSCASPSVTLIGSISSPTNAAISWSGLSVCGSSSSATTSACAADIYTLTATDPANGCSSFDLVEVFANAGAPLISASSTTTLDCITTSANIIATTTISPVYYSWTGSGIISGATTSTAVVNQPGTYTVVVTDIGNGCSTTSVVTVSQDITLPTITVTSSSTIICNGSSVTMTATGANSYNWSPGGQTTNTVSVSPTNTTNYTIMGIGLNGCSNSVNQTIVVNPLPAVSINGATNICKGSTTTLFAVGATSYTWNSGANTTFISVSPTVTTSYSIIGEDANGCINTSTTSVNIVAAKNISGVITNTAGTTAGDLILYKYTPGLSLWDSITTVPLSSSYSFTNIDSSLYVIRAIPTATNIQVTYADSATTWQNATVITHGCTNNTNQNIKLIPLDNLGGGPGILTGFIIQDDGFGARMSNEFKPMVPGTPIGGIVVKGGKNPGGSMFTQTTTAASGGYTLTNIPLSTGSDHYFIYVDIPGLDTSASYHKVITTTNSIYQNLNWSVDSMYIKPIGEITTIKNNNSLLNNAISVFPNPASAFVNIQYELVQSADIQITLYDVIGNKVQEIEPAGYREKNKYNHLIKTGDLSSGIYFIKMKINNSENTIKIIIN